MFVMKIFLVVILVVLLSDQISGHGMVLDPPNRASLWRFDKEAPINYDDNANFCGGRQVQWELYNGTCGVCGDNYGLPQPRDNENTGKYGQGKVVKSYQNGSVITVNVLITANHLGWFQFNLCQLPDPDLPEQEECFFNLTLADGSDLYKLPTSDTGYFPVDVKLPENVTCDRCVLRWHYNTGNSWGICPDGEGKLGCGPQETFKTCSDIEII